MSMVCGLDLHRQQITLDSLATEAEEVRRGVSFFGNADAAIHFEPGTNNGSLVRSGCQCVMARYGTVGERQGLGRDGTPNSGWPQPSVSVAAEGITRRRRADLSDTFRRCPPRADAGTELHGVTVAMLAEPDNCRVQTLTRWRPPRCRRRRGSQPRSASRRRQRQQTRWPGRGGGRTWPPWRFGHRARTARRPRRRDPTAR